MRFLSRRLQVVLGLSVATITLFAAGPAPAPTPVAQTGQTSSPAENAARLHVYADRIAALAIEVPTGASLTAMLPALMQQAETRSATGRASEENAAALLALAFYVNAWPLNVLVPDARTWRPAVARDLRLRGRQDLAQHFAVSALIASAAGTPIATMAGIYKEMNDSRGGSGFSFSDIAADQAGTMFGQRAAASTDSARDLQARVGAGITEDDLMPTVSDLADNMPEAEFIRRFGGVGAPAYNAVIAEIARRVEVLPLFRRPVAR